MEAALARCAELKSRDGECNTALHRAAMRITGRACAWLLERGANPHARDGTGDSPLHIAALFGSLSSCRALWACGADLKVFNDAGQVPIALSSNEPAAHLNTAHLFLHAAGGQPVEGWLSQSSRFESAVLFGELGLVIAAIEEDTDPPSLPGRMRAVLPWAGEAAKGVVLSWLAARSAQEALSDWTGLTNLDRIAGGTRPGSAAGP